MTVWANDAILVEEDLEVLMRGVFDRSVVR